MIDTVDVYRGGTLLVRGAVLRQLRVGADGVVSGQIRAESATADLTLMTVTDMRQALRLTLADGRVVEFWIFQAATVSGGWAKLNGRVVSLPPPESAC